MRIPPKKERRLLGRRTTSTKGVAATSWTNETTIFAVFLVPFVAWSRTHLDGSCILAVAREDLGDEQSDRRRGINAGTPGSK